jgi:hypothetical protein
MYEYPLKTRMFQHDSLTPGLSCWYFRTKHGFSHMELTERRAAMRTQLGQELLNLVDEAVRAGGRRARVRPGLFRRFLHGLTRKS